MNYRIKLMSISRGKKEIIDLPENAGEQDAIMAAHALYKERHLRWVGLYKLINAREFVGAENNCVVHKDAYYEVEIFKIKNKVKVC